MTSCREVRSGRVVGAVAGVDGGVAETDGEHGLADAGRPDEQHIGGVLEEAESGELVDELAVNR